MTLIISNSTSGNNVKELLVLKYILMKRIRNILCVGLVALVAALTTYSQVGIDRMVNAYSLVTATWSSFTVGTLNYTTSSGGAISATALSAGTLTIGGAQATTVSGILTTNATVDIGATGTNVTSTVTVTLPGATTNCTVAFQLIDPHPSFRYNAFVSAADTITLYASNISITNAINPPAIGARFTVFKY